VCPSNHRSVSRSSRNLGAWRLTVLDAAVTLAELTRVFRQEDEGFVAVLNDLRHGIVLPQTIDLLNSTARPLATENGVLPTVIYCTNAAVDQKNSLELERLPGAQVRSQPHFNVVLLHYPRSDGDAACEYSLSFTHSTLTLMTCIDRIRTCKVSAAR